MKKIIFFGTPKFAVAPLKALAENGYQIEAVVTNPDKPKGRGKKLASPPLKVEALKYGLTVLQPHSLRTDKEFFNKIKSINADLFILSAYAKIIPKEYINIPPLGTINIHPSLLPKYRGPSPIQTVILEGEGKTGVTLIVLDEEFDHGPIIAQKEYLLTGRETFTELHDALSEVSAKLLAETLPQYIEGKIKPVEQEHEKATFTKIFTREDGEIDWNDPAEKIDRQIRALNPEPGTFTYFEEQEIKMLKIHGAEPYEKDFGKDPGTVVMDNKEIYVQTGKGSLKIISLQLEGKNIVRAREFANGYPNFAGAKLTKK